MDVKRYPRVGETIFHERLENGLAVYVAAKEEFNRSYAFFATHYGGMDMRFRTDGEWQDTPAGVAHFLEHKMFDMPHGNALQTLSANGASPNAFTGIDVTGYYFSTREHFEENLRTLLSFVSTPYFTKESVDKEQGIIGQEIRMVEDDPENQVFFAMLAGLYQNHPIRTNIIGTVQSISQITADTLYACHRAFYDPANMALCVAGNVDPERVLSLAREILPPKGGEPVERDYGGEEALEAVCRRTQLEMEVSTPIFQLGWKVRPARAGEDRMSRRVLFELALEVLLGTSSPLYAELYSQGLVNQNYSYGYEEHDGCAFLTVGGESPDPDALMERIMARGERIAAEGVDEALFERLKKASYGAWVRSLNSFEHLCIGMAQAHFAKTDFLTFPQIYDKLEKQQIEAVLREYITPERAALAVVMPKEEL